VPIFLRRFWNAIKPPPAVRKWQPTRGQRQMLVGSGVALGLIVAGGGIWAYITSAPQRAQSQADQGTLLMVPGSYRQAIGRFNRAIEISPHFAQAYYERGVAHHLLGETEAARADFTSAISENTQFGAAYTERGTVLRELGDLQRALDDFTRAVEVRPSADGYYQRGQAYASLGQPRKAIEDFDRAIAELPDAPAIYRARAEAKKNIGDLEGSKADRDQSIQNEYRGTLPAWVDRPLPPNTPGTALGQAETRTKGR
jgi:tetratricopeptide (TPR) repeat protein